MTGNRRRTIGRAALVVTVAVAVTLPTALLPPPEPAAVAPIEVEVPAGDRTLVCPGPVRPVAVGTGEFEPGSVRSTSTVTAATVQALAPTAPIQLAPLGGDLIAATTAATPAATLSTATDTALVLTAESTPPLAAAIAGTSVTVAMDGDLRGLAAAACQPAAVEAWLVGADTTGESSTRLVVTNPASTPATVQVSVYGPAGPVLDTPRTFAVAPGRSESVLLETFAPGQSALVVHVVATVKVTAWLQTSRLRGLVPTGVDHVVPGALPDTRLLVGPVPAPATTIGAVDVPVLRLLAPVSDTTVRVRLFGPDGPVEVPGLETVRLIGGQVLDVGLGGIPAGPYVVSVTSGAPVVAGALAVDPGSDGDPVEIAWAASTATNALDASGVVAIPAGTNAHLTATGDGPEPVEYRLRTFAADGSLLAMSTLTVRPGVVATVPLASGEQVVAIDEGDDDAAGLVAWSVLLLDAQDPGLFGAVQPTPYPAAQTTVLVRVE